MKINKKILILMMIITVSGTLMSCSTQNDDEKIKGDLNSEIKSLNGLEEKFQIVKEDSKIKSQGIDKNYNELNGNVDVLNIYAVNETEEIILYSSKFNQGSVRLILVKPSGEAIDIVKGNGENLVNVKVPSGKSIIKLIGSKATGNLKISVTSLNNDDIKKNSK